MFTEVSNKMKRKARGAEPMGLRPVEVTYTFAVSDRTDQVHTFSVAADLMKGIVDLGVTFTGSDGGREILPAELFDSVRAALGLVTAKVKQEDLVERDD